MWIFRYLDGFSASSMKKIKEFHYFIYNLIIFATTVCLFRVSFRANDNFSIRDAIKHGDSATFTSDILSAALSALYSLNISIAWYVYFQWFILFISIYCFLKLTFNRNPWGVFAIPFVSLFAIHYYRIIGYNVVAIVSGVVAIYMFFYWACIKESKSFSPIVLAGLLLVFLLFVEASHFEVFTCNVVAVKSIAWLEEMSSAGCFFVSGLCFYLTGFCVFTF